MRRRRLVGGLAVLGLLAALGWWWLRDGGSETGPKAGAHSSANGGTARLGGHRLPGAPRWLGQAGLEMRRVAGRVTHRGAPVAGAVVRLELAGALRGALPAAEVKTGPDGSFDFGAQVPASLLVIANAPDRAPAGAAVDLRDPTRAPPPDHLELALGDCAHSIHGIVHDHGSGIAEAAVRIATSEESIAIATTGEDGGYQLCIGPGSGQMVVEADGYARAQLEIEPGKRTRRDVELSPEALLSGVVVGPDERPVAGALVHARASEPSPFAMETASGVTDDEGRFALGGLSPGRYQIGARDAGRRTVDEVEAVAEVAGGDPLTLRLVDMVTVKGRVLEDGKPVAGARLAHRTGRFLGMGSSRVGAASAVSQRDGSFVLDAVPPGPFSLAVDGYEVLAPAIAEAVAPETEVVVEVAGKARVVGRVTQGGSPVAGAQVQLRGTAGGWGGWARTKTDGTYEIGGLEAGSYQIGAQTENAFARKRTVAIAKGQRLEGIDIELDLAGEVSGVVVDQRGDPVAGVAVVFELGKRVDFGFATSEEDGSFVAGAMSGGGTYKVTVKPTRWSPVELRPAPGTSFPPVTLADGTSRATGIRLAVQLDREDIRGVVVGSDGKPAADVKVAAHPAGRSHMMMRFSPPAAATITGDDGTFALGPLMSGEYDVRAVAGSGVEATAEKVPAGRRDLRLELPAAGAIDGTLVGFSEEARVSAHGSTPFARFTARVRGTHFTIEGMPPGSYMVSAREGARSDDALADVTAGRRVTVTLTSTGTATVSGRAVDLVSRAPLPGLECAESAGWMDRGPATTTDAQGRFRLEIPAGRPATVHCMSPTARFRTMGSAHVELEPGTTGEVVVEVIVARRTGSQPGDLGLHIQPGPPATVYKVDPGGPAERAGVEVGDAILTVDGVAVDKLPSSQVLSLMLDHAIGEKVELVLRRDGHEVTASVEVVERKREDG